MTFSLVLSNVKLLMIESIVLYSNDYGFSPLYYQGFFGIVDKIYQQSFYRGISNCW